MKIVTSETINFILLSGIDVQSPVKLSASVELQPTDTSHIDLKTALATCSEPDDIAVVAAFIPRITAQFCVTAKSPKELAVLSWNTSWDALLLSAIFHTEIGFNLQSDTPANKITSESTLRATNLQMRGLNNLTAYRLTNEDSLWVLSHFSEARQMLDNDRFQTAIHCLASYRWHAAPRIKMAVIWAGIEGIFGASTEIRFRLSLYTARFLYPDNIGERQKTFDDVKRLYNTRSQAVHGAKIKKDIGGAVGESAQILREILIRCIEKKSLPIENELAP
jgi:hypothetical protein